jgi:hypothetical protein
MRRADFWTSLILFAMAVGMIGSAMTMPLKESFAGVQNVWYVSPALFPLLIAGSLLLLATTLMHNAIRTGGAQAALATVGRWTAAHGNGTTRMLVSIGILAAYVYGLIPRVDYVVSTTLFLLVFIGAFYLGNEALMRIHAAVLLSAGAAALAASLAGVYPPPGTMPRYALDLVVLLVTAALALATWRRVASDPLLRRRYAMTLGVSLAVALLTSVSFKFGLLVPLPAEGAVVRLLEDIQLALRALGT